MKKLTLTSLLLVLSFPALAQTTATLGENSIGTACSNGANAANFDTLAQCSATNGSGTFQKAPLFAGKVTSPPYASTACDANKAGMIQFNGTAFQGCDGASWGSIPTSLLLGTSTANTSPFRSGDITTGLFSSAASTVSIATAGLERVTVDPNGYVGIGTASPSQKLVVAGNAVVSSSTQYQGFSVNNGTYDVAALQGSSATNDVGDLALSSGGTIKAYITANGVSHFDGGNVGIGTASPRYKLEVNGQIIQTAAYNANNYLSSYDLGVGTIGAGSSIYSYGLICAGNNSSSCNDASGVVLQGSGSNTYGNVYISGSGNTYFNGGNVGVGTTSPSKLLQVGSGDGVMQAGSAYGAQISGYGGGDALFSSNIYDSAGTLKTVATHENYGYAGVGASWGQVYFYAYRGATTADATVTPNARMIITYNGDVGIGMTSPGAKLDVGGTVHANDITTSRGDGTGALFLGGSSHYLYWDNTNYSLPGGGLYVNGTYYASDKRLKTDITALGDGHAMEVINQLAPMRFHWKPNSEQAKTITGYDFGLIAQDVQKILPEVVREVKNAGPGLPGGKKTKPTTLNEEIGKTLTIDYQRLIPWALAGLKEVGKDQKTLELRLKDLQAENNSLHDTVKAQGAALQKLEARLQKVEGRGK